MMPNHYSSQNIVEWRADAPPSDRAVILVAVAECYACGQLDVGSTVGYNHEVT